MSDYITVRNLSLDRRKVVEVFVSHLVNAYASANLPIGVPAHRRKAENGTYLTQFDFYGVLVTIKARLTACGELIVRDERFSFNIFPGTHLDPTVTNWISKSFLDALVKVAP